MSDKDTLIGNETTSCADEKKELFPWYKEGLRFSCTECGKCCTGTPGLIFVSEEEMQKMAEYLSLPLDLFKRKYTKKRDNRYLLVELKSKNFSCVFLENKKCSIYPVRPIQCQTFPWWKENLKSKESWLDLATACEGIREEAEVVPFTEIQRMLVKNGDQESQA